MKPVKALENVLFLGDIFFSKPRHVNTSHAARSQDSSVSQKPFPPQPSSSLVIILLQERNHRENIQSILG